MSIWKVTSTASTPALLCGYIKNDISDDATVRLIKQMLKRAKQENVAISAITVRIDDEDTMVDLHGTEGARYDS